jgi:hypothetical protein
MKGFCIANTETARNEILDTRDDISRMVTQLEGDVKEADPWGTFTQNRYNPAMLSNPDLWFL